MLFTNEVCFSYFTSDAQEFFLHGVCVDNEENIALAIDLSSGESKTKKNGSRKTLNVGKSLHSNSRKLHR